VRFDEVDFGGGGQKSVEVRARASSAGALEIRVDSPEGPVIGKIGLDAKTDWTIAKARVKALPAGVHDLFVTQAGSGRVEADWVRFR
jgi:hypothetical protein